MAAVVTPNEARRWWAWYAGTTGWFRSMKIPTPRGEVTFIETPKGEVEMYVRSKRGTEKFMGYAPEARAAQVRYALRRALREGAPVRVPF